MSRLSRFLFGCSHKWKLHKKKKYNWRERVMISGTNETQKLSYSKTIEIFICKHCGKIETIEY